MNGPLSRFSAFETSPRRGLEAGADAAGFFFVEIGVGSRHQSIGPLFGVGNRGLQLEPQPLAGGVQPALDGAQGNVELAGHLHQRQAADIEGDQALAIERLEAS